MSSQSANVAVFLGLMLASKQIPFDNSAVLFGARLLYVSIILSTLGLFLWIRNGIEKQRDLSVLKIPESSRTTFSTVQSSTIYDYDKQQCRSHITGVLVGILMFSVMHLYFKLPNPLLIQSFMTMKGAVQSNLVQIHVLGKPAVGDLERPWQGSEGFASIWRHFVPNTNSRIVQK